MQTESSAAVAVAPVPMRRFFADKSHYLLAVCILTSFVLAACGGTETDRDMSAMAELLPEEANGWVRRDSIETYDRESIFDYIDGAGEVYNSYAFRRVVVAHYARSDSPEVTVELFDMGKPSDAYGVFSYAKEDEAAGIGGGYQQRGNVLCFWQNRYYVCVAVEEPVAEMAAVLQSFGGAISERLPRSSDRPDLVGLLPPENRVPHSDRFFHSHSSLNYHYYLARENILQLGPGTDAVTARYQPASTYLVIVRYESENQAAAALNSFREAYLPDANRLEIVKIENRKYVSSRQCGRCVVVVLDAPSEESARELTNAVVAGMPAQEK